jgi:hypothetical protein
MGFPEIASNNSGLNSSLITNNDLHWRGRQSKKAKPNRRGPQTSDETWMLDTQPLNSDSTRLGVIAPGLARGLAPASHASWRPCHKPSSLLLWGLFSRNMGAAGSTRLKQNLLSNLCCQANLVIYGGFEPSPCEGYAVRSS